MTVGEGNSPTTPSGLSDHILHPNIHADHHDESNHYQESAEAMRMPQGIDFQQALTILSSRSAAVPVKNPSRHIHQENGGRVGSCGCGGHGMELTKDVTGLGQTIDWMATTEDSQGEPKTSSSMEEQERERQVEERSKRLQKIQAELKSMSNHELLQAVLQVQEDRVAAYRDYERGLLTVLQTGNITFYPDTCSKATASFSVLSETIKAIQEILDVDRARNDLVKLVTQLQGHERKKLQLTAAYHLERMRQRNHYQMTVDPSQPNKKDDDRIERLLIGGVQSLHHQISSCVDEINETIDEIRMVLVEENEEG